MMSAVDCQFCGCANTVPLPRFDSGRAVLSDGRLVLRSVGRRSCFSCGGAFLWPRPTEKEITGWYTDSYRLPNAAPNATMVRATAYAKWIVGVLGNRRPTRIFEFGAGSGALMRCLSDRFPDAELEGYDLAAVENIQLSERITLYSGQAESVPVSPADLIVSVNVIEHVSNPIEFLRAMKKRALPRAELVIICPQGETPNMELVFLDHLSSFTPLAMAHCARGAGLTIAATAPAPREIGDFRLYRFCQMTQPAIQELAEIGNLAAERSAYLSAWQRIDAELERRLSGGGAIAAFGAGQMASLLRAYAPRSWALVSHLELDCPADAWNLGKPVRPYLPSGTGTLLLAVAPQGQALLARRFNTAGRTVVRFDDLIAR